MKEKLCTIPLNDAIAAHDECPFCFIERSIEQDLLDFTLGSASSYMESDVREKTDQDGFCRAHYKKMFEYGNTLGNGWILKTHLMRLNKEMTAEFKRNSSVKVPGGFLKTRSSAKKQNSVSEWIAQKEESCYICNQFKENFERYLDTFFQMYRRDDSFRQNVRDSKGFCLTHFGDICEYAQTHLNDKERNNFFPELFQLMEKNMSRIFDDVAWLIEKFDYKNKEADWKNSKDAIQRAMQKVKGGYPADQPYTQKK